MPSTFRVWLSRMTVLPVPLSAGLFAALNAQLGAALAARAADAGAAAGPTVGTVLLTGCCAALAALIAGRTEPSESPQGVAADNKEPGRKPRLMRCVEAPARQTE